MFSEVFFQKWLWLSSIVTWDNQFNLWHETSLLSETSCVFQESRFQSKSMNWVQCKSTVLHGSGFSPACCQNWMCLIPTVTSLSITTGLYFTTNIFSFWPLQEVRRVDVEYKWHIEGKQKKNKLVLRTLCQSGMFYRHIAPTIPSTLLVSILAFSLAGQLQLSPKTTCLTLQNQTPTFLQQPLFHRKNFL